MENTQEILKCRTFVCQACGDIIDIPEDEVETWLSHEWISSVGAVPHEECPGIADDGYCNSTYREFTEDLYVQMYVNLYDVHRAYGGPEEGGWWYDAGSAVASIPVPGKIVRDVRHGQSVLRTVAEGAYVLMAKEILKASYGETDDERDVRVEDHPAEDYPRRRPHYE